MVKKRKYIKSGKFSKKNKGLELMVKKRKYIKSGKFSKKNKGLVTESCQQYGPIRGKNVFKVSVLKLTIDFIASSTSSTVQQESSNSQSFESPLSNRVDHPRVIVKTKRKMRRPKLPRCPHRRQRSKCKVCGGKGVCTHGRVRSSCKDCGSKGFCSHGRQRSRCKDCGGKGVCTHGRLRCTCKDCGGGGICEHGRRRSRCSECETRGNNGVSRKSGKSRSNPPDHFIDNMQFIKKEVSER
jgi:hypothetical protein